MRVVMTGEHPVQRVGHCLSDVAMQVEHRDDRHGLAQEVAHRRREIPFEVLEVLHHARPVQIQADGIDRTGRVDPGEDFLPERFVCLGPDRAGRLGGGDQDGHDLESQPLTSAHGSTRGAPRIPLTEDRGAAALVERRRRGRVLTVGVRLVAYSRNRDAGHCILQPGHGRGI